MFIAGLVVTREYREGLTYIPTKKSNNIWKKKITKKENYILYNLLFLASPQPVKKGGLFNAFIHSLRVSKIFFLTVTVQ